MVDDAATVTVPGSSLRSRGGAETPVSEAAIDAARRLRDAVGGTFRIHAAGDGGLICEERTRPSRPLLWRVRADGTVDTDTRYNFVARRFVTAQLPLGVG